LKINTSDNREIKLDSYLRDEEQGLINNPSKNFDSFLRDGIDSLKSINSSIEIKYDSDILSLEDTFSNNSYGLNNSKLNDNYSVTSSSIKIKECDDIISLEDTVYAQKKSSDSSATNTATENEEEINENNNNKDKIKTDNDKSSDFITSLSDNADIVKNTHLNDKEMDNEKKVENKEYQVIFLYYSLILKLIYVKKILYIYIYFNTNILILFYTIQYTIIFNS